MMTGRYTKYNTVREYLVRIQLIYFIKIHIHKCKIQSFFHDQSGGPYRAIFI